MADQPICGAIKGGEKAGEPCMNPAGYGTTHPGIGRCLYHYGNTPSHQHAANKIKVRQMVEDLATQQGWDPNHVDPATVLAEELARTFGIVRIMEGETNVEDAMWPEWQRVWMEERKHSVNLAKLMLDVGIAERIAKVQEAQVMQLAGAIRGILGRLDLSEQQQLLAREAVPEVLGELAAGGTPNGH